MYFIMNLNGIESEMRPGDESMTHITITVLLYHTKHELQYTPRNSTAKGCYSGRRSDSTPKYATLAYHFYSCQ